MAPEGNPFMSIHGKRKADHIRINLYEDIEFNHLTSGLEKYRFIHDALPELSLESVRTDLALFGRELKAPLLISPMTGGTEQAAEINRALAVAAQEAGIALGIGSQRAAFSDEACIESFRVRHLAPDVLIMANLGAVQLNYGFDVGHCERAVEMIEADALVLHANPMQEALQPEGNVDFSGLLGKIEKVCRALSVPVVVKEVGFGLSADACRRLADAGVAALDVAGAGGTSWSQVEMHRADTPARRVVAAAFADWGIPTATALLMARGAAPDLPIIASGGLRDGLDVAKCIALGAVLAGMARPFLKAAVTSSEDVLATVDAVTTQLRIAMFCIGAADLSRLRDTPALVEL